MNTIIALATNIENSSIVIIRISGGKSIFLLEKLTRFTYKKQGLYIRKIFIKKKFIDEVVLNVYKKPHSFTGENVVEIMAHANQIIVDEIMNFFIINGCKLAKKGEFLEQAFLNRKITFEKAQLINEIIRINNKNILDLYREKYNNKNISKTLLHIRNLIENIIMENDLAIEYPEYEKNDKSKTTLKKITTLKTLLETQLKQIESIQQLEEGIKVAIVGEPNVGKSSLFNNLLNKNRSIITKIPGTTTDYIEDHIILRNGVKLMLIDTAGLRKTRKKIEKIGITKTLSILKNAQIILWLANSKHDFKNFLFLINSNIHVIKIISKSDLLIEKKETRKFFYTSIYDKNSINKLLEKLNALTSNIIKDIKKRGVILISNKTSILEIINNFNIIRKGLEKGFTIDIFRSLLEECLSIANSLLGEGKNYDYIERIFRTFCIGK